MIKAAEYDGTVPYGQQCEAAIACLLPVGTYFELIYPQAAAGPAKRIGRVAEKLNPYTNGGAIEEGGSVRYFSGNHPTAVVVPLTDQEALNKVPVGSKVTIFAVDTSLGSETRFVEALVVRHLKRRVKVAFTFNDGTPHERDLYVSQLVKF